jgi:hypothetical protein
MGLDFEHMIKAKAHRGDMRIGKTPQKLASICCSQCRETKADTLKATEANRRRGPRTREKIRSKRINLVTHLHRKLMCINSLYSYPYINYQKPLFLPIIAYTHSSTKLEIRAK